MTLVQPQERENRKALPILGLLSLLLVLGAGLRLFDLTDQPIDFHPTRQLRGAIIARGMYYQMLSSAEPTIRQQAATHWSSTGQYEPSILERITAISYLALGHEAPWAARVVNTLLWLVGGLTLYLLSRRMIQEVNLDSISSTSEAALWLSALIILAYYLVLPFSVQASRSFQPDPGMVVWILLAAYAAFRWAESQAWRWAIPAGIFSGLAILTKAVAFYPIAGLLLFLTFHTFTRAEDGKVSKALGRLLRSFQVWSIAALALLPTVIYYLSRGGRASEYFSSWTAALSHLLLEPQTYLRWLNLVQELVNPAALLVALIGLAVSRGRSRALLAGLWVGYLAYGLFLPYQMTTHNYYHLQLVPLVALSSALAIYKFLSWLSARRLVWQLLFAGGALCLLIYSSWQALIPLYSQDYRDEPAYWQEIASYLPQDGKIIALTQDYGYRLMYYGWRKVTLWPNRGEIKLNNLRGSTKEFQEFFEKRTDGKSYFLITAFGQFEDQPALQEMLYENYLILAQGNGYLIFDLTHPMIPALVDSLPGDRTEGAECHPFR